MVMFAGEHTTPYHQYEFHEAHSCRVFEGYPLRCLLEPVANDRSIFGPINCTSAFYRKNVSFTTRHSLCCRYEVPVPAKVLNGSAHTGHRTTENAGVMTRRSKPKERLSVKPPP
jgi:hypothetical protein